MTLIRSALIGTLGIAVAGEVAAVEWNVSLWGERRAFTEHVHKLAELVEEKTDGEFTMNISYGGLSNPRENLDGISIGAFEMVQFCAGYHVDKNPTITVLELPFLGVTNLEEEVAVSHAVYDHPAVQDDLGRWNARLLMTSPMPQYNLVGTGEPRDELGEFEGMRVRATGGLGQAFEAAGAVPTSMAAPEVYTSLESGVIDTAAFAQHAHLSFGTIDLAEWWTENLNPGTVNCPVVVNTDAYAALSPEHQEALDSSIDAAIDHYLQNYDQLLTEWDSILQEKGVERISISEDELERFREVAAPIRESWIADMDQQGLPGQELYELVQQTLEEQRGAE
jgi:TRAP-type C4-dicarboxylate transport system substrate-binding protein